MKTTTNTATRIKGATPAEILDLARAGYFTAYLYDDVGGGYHASYSTLQAAIDDTAERASYAHVAIVHHGKTVYKA